MSVDFTASIKLGFLVSENEMAKLYNELDNDDLYDEIRDEYLISINSYDDDSDLIFVIKEVTSTSTCTPIDFDSQWMDFEDKEKCAVFHKYFERDAEDPKFYLIQEVW